MAEVTPIFEDSHLNPSHSPDPKHHLSDLALPTSPQPHPKKHRSTHDTSTTIFPHSDLASEPEADDAASISSSILHRHHEPHRRAHLPPLPDLRFEQSYLASISSANGDPWKIFLITVRDQVVFPLVQGMLFSLGVAMWRAWNSRARFLGRGLGARLRRWWWQVNKWEIPEK